VGATLATGEDMGEAEEVEELGDEKDEG